MITCTTRPMLVICDLVLPFVMDVQIAFMMDVEEFVERRGISSMQGTMYVLFYCRMQ